MNPSCSLLFLFYARRSLSDVSSFNMERVITIKGSIENMSRAESMISAKLRQSYESDLQVPPRSRNSRLDQEPANPLTEDSIHCISLRV